MPKKDISSSFQNLASIKISSITLDDAIQPRCQIYDDVVTKYAAAMRQGEKFPPVIVFYNGSKFWLVDGFHRLHAKKAIGELEVLAAISQGNRLDAILHAIGANLESELKLTKAEVDKNIFKLMCYPEWRRWSDKEIASHCGTNDKHVHDLREQGGTDLYNMVVEINKISDPTPREPLKAKHFDLESALNGDATSFGPLISDYFLDIWTDMVIDKIIKKQMEESKQSEN